MVRFRAEEVERRLPAPRIGGYLGWALLPRSGHRCGASRPPRTAEKLPFTLGGVVYSINSSARASGDRRHPEAERFGGRHIDDQLEAGRFLHRQVAGLSPPFRIWST